MTTTPDTKHVSIVTTAEPCWVVLVDGQEIDHHASDGIAHFAEAEADDYHLGVARQLDKPCVTLACALCEAPYDLDAADCIFHFDNLAQALADASGTDWTVRDGRAYCPEHPQEDDDQ